MRVVGLSQLSGDGMEQRETLTRAHWKLVNLVDLRPSTWKVLVFTTIHLSHLYQQLF